MKYYVLSIVSDVSEEEVQKLLLSYGAEFLYSTLEGTDQILNIAVLFDGDPDQLSLNISGIQEIQQHHYDGIDWDDQWNTHCEGYANGSVEIDLNPYLKKKDNAKIKMQSGPGFGDLSHPTTRLVLKLSANLFKNRNILDVGCGSGILSLAAMACGAYSVIGVDIDPLSIEHSKQNLSINSFSRLIKFGLVEELKEDIYEMKKPLILMNMIRSEQEVAWNSIKNALCKKLEIVTSGVRIEEREDYLIETLSRDWILVDELGEEDWLAFRFKSI